MHVAGKVWGRTAEVFKTPLFELHRIQVQAGHRCSEHRHATKFNGFTVESGLLRVRVWQSTGTVDETVLSPGESLVVPPGVFHQFIAETDVVAYEAYWTELRSDDIDRRTVGE